MTSVRLRWMSVTLLGLGAFCVDRISKLYFVHNFSDQISVIGQWVILQYHLNLAMALSLPLFPLIYYSLTIIIILVLLVQACRSIQQEKLFDYAIILFILVGAISNLADRFLYGGVVDFITVSFGSVFNLADVYIVCAVLVWLLRLSHNNTANTHVPKPYVSKTS